MGQKPSQADGRMASLADVRAYLSGDRIACLICGQQVRGVGGHVRMVHGITAREYKQRFGLPVTRGLEPQDVRQRRAESVAATRAAGRLLQTPPPCDPTRPGKPEYVHHDMRRTTESDVHAIMGWLSAGDTITEACERPGMPSWSALHFYLKRSPEMQSRFDALVESLPFAQQARMKKLGARFRTAADALAGMTCKAAGEALGVSDDVVRRHRTTKKSENPPVK
ncbi:MAG: hypothetical protein BGO66_03030 [Alicycliphilus sp. 69-12]|nr:MAG: hypothetical protein BGO66_03030 [Alicycliphilus sp. 69-12]